MIRYDFDINNIPNINSEISITLGYFDGLHLGHIELIKKSQNVSKNSALLTFDMGDNPLIKRKEMLTSLSDREQISSSLNLSYYLVLKFDEVVKNLSPSEFIEKVLRPLNVKHIIIGKDYRFGSFAKGDVNYLLNYEKRFYEVHVVEDVYFSNERISTTRIINEISLGNVKLASKLLSRYYFVKGKVVKGLQNGKKFSFPTANLELTDFYVLPKNGVYMGYVTIDEKKYKAMINVGKHPTISKLEDNIVEAHILDFNENIYEKEVKVEFVDYLRDEKKFSTVEELIDQLKVDKDKCIKLL